MVILEVVLSQGRMIYIRFHANTVLLVGPGKAVFTDDDDDGDSFNAI